MNFSLKGITAVALFWSLIALVVWLTWLAPIPMLLLMLAASVVMLVVVASQVVYAAYKGKG